MQKIHRDFPFKFNGLDSDLTGKILAKNCKVLGTISLQRSLMINRSKNWKESGNRKIRKIFDGIIEEGIIKSRVRRRTDEFSSVSTCLSVTLSRK